MILVDSSVAIDYAKGRDAKLNALLPKLPVAICGITRAEVLHGALNPADRGNLLTILARFQQVSIPDALWDVVGDHLAALRAAGIRVPFPDVVIASLGISLGVEVWTRDKQFALIQGALPALALFQEPP
jgi:predicted nucleic acid-binding protein